MIAGDLPRRALALVLEWARLREAELMIDWELAREQEPLNGIEPLE